MTSPSRATTDVEAASLALGLLDEPAISSFDEPDRTAARECKKWYGTALDKALSRTDWNFAATWCVPARDAATNAGILKNRFVLPNDCIRVREVYDGDPSDASCKLGDNRWNEESAKVTLGGADVIAKVLVCNADSVSVKYTRRVDTVALWDADFLMAFAHRLARYVAPKLGKSGNEVAELKQEAVAEADEAAGNDARESAPKQISRNTSWIAARGGRGGWRGSQ